MSLGLTNKLPLTQKDLYTANSQYKKQLKQDEQENEAQLNAQLKYTDRASLRKDGVDTALDKAGSQWIQYEQNKKNVAPISLRLKNEQDAFNKFDSILKKFDELVPYTNVNEMPFDQRKKYANDALQEIQKLMGTRNVNGDYILGGANPRAHPLLNNGVMVDLTEVSNFKYLDGTNDGFITWNNFSQVRNDDTQLKISSLDNVSRSIMCATTPALVNSIAYLNAYKNEDTTTGQKEKLFQLHRDELSDLSSRFNNSEKNIEAADKQLLKDSDDIHALVESINYVDIMEAATEYSERQIKERIFVKRLGNQLRQLSQFLDI